MFAEGELLRIVLACGGGLALAGLLFFLAARLARAGRRRVAKAIEALDVSRLERVARETAGETTRLRFTYRGQRALLDFVEPRTTAVHALAPHVFGGLEDPNLPLTRLRFWLVPPPAMDRKSDVTGDEVEGAWSPEAKAQLEALRRLHLEGLGVAVTREGLFLMKAGWLPAADLQAFVDGACALAGMALDGTLDGGPSAATTVR
jgi:hypothetical protein